ncbi:hypothetical protein B0T17DRAFT_613784 [Bombardia bombarda]|uniref:Uncharacterized protein n=1 Tax=Bombardia bombarda TaxID=252184 RepID=A0AA39XPS4_9PEZI|nr:hypothetical protein B0T17DRAFT_613784 [Bombardia bombarda]
MPGRGILIHYFPSNVFNWQRTDGPRRIMTTRYREICLRNALVSFFDVRDEICSKQGVEDRFVVSFRNLVDLLKKKKVDVAQAAAANDEITAAHSDAHTAADDNTSNLANESLIETAARAGEMTAFGCAIPEYIWVKLVFVSVDARLKYLRETTMEEQFDMRTLTPLVFQTQVSYETSPP